MKKVEKILYLLGPFYSFPTDNKFTPSKTSKNIDKIKKYAKITSGSKGVSSYW